MYKKISMKITNFVVLIKNYCNTSRAIAYIQLINHRENSLYHRLVIFIDEWQTTCANDFAKHPFSSSLRLSLLKKNVE